MNFDQVLAEYGPLLGRVANSYEANHALQQELLQEIAVAVWQGLARFQGNSSLKTYILKIAHNRAVSHVATSVKQIKGDDGNALDAISAAHEHNPDVAMEHSQQMSRLLEAVRELGLPARQVVTLSLEGLSYEDIAEVCGLSTSNVGVILNRAKQTLSRRIQHG